MHAEGENSESLTLVEKNCIRIFNFDQNTVTKCFGNITKYC